jgi:hypothetical protein
MNKGNLFRYYKPNVVIGFIILSGSLIGGILTFIIKSINSFSDLSYYQYPSASVFVGFLVFIIDRYLWKKSPFNLLFQIPNLSGRYEGQIKYVNPITKEKEEKKCIAEVFQTGSQVKFNCYFEKSSYSERTKSESLVETITKNEDDTFSLVFTYRNHGLPNLFQEHSGTNILNFIENENGKFLKGIYYTNREPHTKGEMEVAYISNKLKHDF